VVIIYLLLDIPLKPDQTLSRENLNTLLKRIDPIGCILAAISIVLFLLGMHFPSASMGYTWSSPLVIGFIAGSCGTLIVFLVFEKFVSPRPLFPSQVILDFHLMCVYIQRFMTGFCYVVFEVLVFIQLQAVYDTTATQAAIRLIPGTICLIICSITGSRLTRKLDRPKVLLFLYFQEVKNVRA
jgi:hypothetical protein